MRREQAKTDVARQRKVDRWKTSVSTERLYPSVTAIRGAASGHVWGRVTAAQHPNPRKWCRFINVRVDSYVEAASAHIRGPDSRCRDAAEPRRSTQYDSGESKQCEQS